MSMKREKVWNEDAGRRLEQSGCAEYSVSFWSPPPNLELLSPAILFKMTWRGDTLDNVYLTYLAFASFPLSPSVLSKTLLPHLCYSSAIWFTPCSFSVSPLLPRSDSQLACSATKYVECTQSKFTHKHKRKHPDWVGFLFCPISP